MPPRKLSDLPQADFSGDEIDNCLFVRNMGTPELVSVPMSNVFNWIKHKAETEGLYVEMKSDRIVFIKTPVEI